ncbi:MAG TPA: hypothetical protein VIP57_03925 [Candidatus Dormibacteraeota bacterium]
MIRVVQLGAGDLELQAAKLARLAVVYADELRMKIVTEAYMREVSPKLIHEEFGGGSVSRVAQHFDRLAGSGWLVLAREETGGARRGAVEHFWRAPELVIFEDETWAALPASMRASFSWVTFEQLTERVSAAIVAGTFDARSDRHLSWTPVMLDQLGWERLIVAADVAFRTVLEEQDRANRRLSKSGERPVLATAALAVFESPMWARHQNDWRRRPYASAQTLGTTAAIDRKSFFPMLSRVCANPLDLRIVDELNRGELSPKRLYDLVDDLTLPGSDRRLRKLARQGWATEVRQETGGVRRGATEHFYRAVGPALIDNESWAEIPGAIKVAITSRTFEQLREKVKEAVDVGTFDARTDRHLTWSLLRLDQVGWKAVVRVVDGFLEALFDEEMSAKQRLADSGEKPILSTISLAAFESPEDSVKVP